jgi:hypothetical protein
VKEHKQSYIMRILDAEYWEVRGVVTGKVEEEFRNLTMKKFSHGKGSLSKALEEALNNWINARATQTTTQISTVIAQSRVQAEKSKSSSSNQTKHVSMWAGSSAWHERLTCTQEDAGSNPARSTTTEHEPEDFQRCLDLKETRV